MTANDSEVSVENVAQDSGKAASLEGDENQIDVSGVAEDLSKPLLGPIGMLAFLVYANSQFWAGTLGINHHLGIGWVIGAYVIFLIFPKLTLQFTVGAFLGATSVWGWHWGFALVFVLPGWFLMPLFAHEVTCWFRSLKGKNSATCNTSDLEREEIKREATTDESE